MPTQSMPIAEVEIDLPLVQRLLASQHPDLADLPLAHLAHGWDNVMIRLGDEYVVRLPRREVAVALIRNEQRVLPLLAEALPLPVPVPLRVGTPELGYPWPWSICPYLPGEIASDAPLFDPVSAAEALGGFLAALHRPAPEDAPQNSVRGGPLRDRTPAMMEGLGALNHPRAETIRMQWVTAVAQAPWSAAPVWLHGDLHPANVVVHDGRVGGVIDFGDVTAGDPATDLAIAWLLFDMAHHARFRAAAGEVDEETWGRARGWALLFSVTYLARSGDNPTLFRIGERGIERLLGP